MVALRRNAAGMLLLLVTGVCRADLAGCQLLAAESEAYKVVMDDLSFATSAAAAGASSINLKERLTFNLRNQLAEFKRDVEGLGIKKVELGVINCLGRKPSLNGTEFTPQRIADLNDWRVVVELWVTLLDRADGVAGGPHAMIGYVIPPMLHYGGAAGLTAPFLIKYPKAEGGSIDVLHKLPEASAFALVGLAVKAQKARNYDLAVWAFGRSEGSIQEAMRSGGTAEISALLAYVRTAACKTRQSARADTNYSGPITLTAAETCGVSP
jgi:hypothetical protein